jgi:hypothetical protein
MQFQVPQFLDVEDKIFGPLTFKQLLYLAGGAGFAYFCIRFIPYLGWFLGIGCGILGGMLAFYKFNNKPFIALIESAFNYMRSDRLFIWKRREKPTDTAITFENFAPTKHAGVGIPAASASKLSDLTWSIDVKQDDTVEAQRVRGENVL